MEPRLSAANFVDVTVPSPADLAAEGRLKNDSLLSEADGPDARLATAERYGSSQPGPVRDAQHAQSLQELTAARTALADASDFTLPTNTPDHRDFLTPMPERPGNAEDRQRTRTRLDALNLPRELNGLGGYATADAAPPGAELGGSAGLEFTDRELDAYADAGIDPVAEGARDMLDRRGRNAAHAANVARREAEYQRSRDEREAQRAVVYDRQAQQAIDAARARGADESWIQFQLSMGTLPGHPGRRH